MDFSVATLLLQDGLTTGAIYALLALALVLVYSVTRVPLIPMGCFVTYSALSLNVIQGNGVPLSIPLLAVMGAGCMLMDIVAWRRSSSHSARKLFRPAMFYVAMPLLLWAMAVMLPLASLPMAFQMAMALSVVVPMAPMMYRLAFQPIQDAGILVIFMIAISIDTALVGMALILFGPDGVRTEPYTDFVAQLGPLTVPGYALWTIGVTLVLVVLLYWFFNRTLEGKKLRATAVNRIGAQLVGIGTTEAGRFAFTLAAVIGAVCGLLIGPTTTLSNTSGVLIGLKGFVAAVIGGFASYPLAAGGALLVGVLESFSSFWVSAWKDVVVFTLIIPVLLVRSLAHAGHDDEH